MPSYESRRQWTSTKLVTHTRPTVNSSDPQIVHSPLDAIAYKRSRSNCFFFSTRVYAKSKECQPGVDPYSRLKYQLFLRLPEATNVHHYIKHATFITYGTQPSNRTYCMSNAHRLKV